VKVTEQSPQEPGGGKMDFMYPVGDGKGYGDGDGYGFGNGEGFGDGWGYGNGWGYGEGYGYDTINTKTRRR